MKSESFTDKKYRLTDFEYHVLVVCLTCKKQALAIVNKTAKQAKLICSHCGLSKICSTRMAYKEGIKFELQQAAHLYFEAKLWLEMPFKNDIFWAYNWEHLGYLEEYISAKLREHKDRSHFTLLEKLPKFYHEAKNREGLLKVIAKLKAKQ